MKHPVQTLLFRRISAGAAVIITVASASAADAQELSFGGEIAFEARYFPDSPAYAGQSGDEQFSLSISPEVSWKSADGNHRLQFRGFLREDSMDDARSHADIREAFYRYSDSDWDIVAGVNQVFWGVTESRHLVNIINQVDALEDVDQEDFLGQPMLQIGRQTDFGRFDMFLIPGLREREFAGVAGRLRPALPVDEAAATFESSEGTNRPEIALRYSHFIGDLDIGLHVFHGTSREPTLTLNGGGTALVPHYPVITQAGLDLQYTTDAALWKLEALVREGQGETFAAAVAGLEYTFYQVFESNADLGLIAEVMYDGRDSSVFPTIYDQDVFIGARLGFNDTSDTSLLAGFLTDMDHGPTAIRLEAKRRLGENWALEGVGQIFLQDEPADAAQVFEQDSFLSLSLVRYF